MYTHTENNRGISLSLFDCRGIPVSIVLLSNRNSIRDERLFWLLFSAHCGKEGMVEQLKSWLHESRGGCLHQGGLGSRKQGRTRSQLWPEKSNCCCSSTSTSETPPFKGTLPSKTVPGGLCWNHELTEDISDANQNIKYGCWASGAPGSCGHVLSCKVLGPNSTSNEDACLLQR